MRNVLFLLCILFLIFTNHWTLSRNKQKDLTVGDELEILQNTTYTSINSTLDMLNEISIEFQNNSFCNRRDPSGSNNWFRNISSTSVGKWKIDPFVFQSRSTNSSNNQTVQSIFNVGLNNQLEMALNIRTNASNETDVNFLYGTILFQMPKDSARREIALYMFGVYLPAHGHAYFAASQSR